MGRLIIIALAVLLTSCHGYYQKHVYGNEESPYFFVPVDSSVELKTPVTIPADTDHVFFQDSKVKTVHEVNRYLPYCELQVSAARSAAQTIQPGEFVVFKVYQLRRNYLVQRGGFVRTGTGLTGMRDDADGSEDFELVVTVLELYSEQQPHVDRVLCAEWGLPQDMSFVTIRMIREQLAGYMDLKLYTGGEPASRTPIPAERLRGKLLGY